MNFYREGDIKAIIAGYKTNERRPVNKGDVLIDGKVLNLRNSHYPRYAVDRTYAVQNRLGEKGVWVTPDGELAPREFYRQPLYASNKNAVERFGTHLYRPLRIRILSIRKQDVRTVSFEDAAAEGYQNPGNDIHPGGYPYGPYRLLCDWVKRYDKGCKWKSYGTADLYPVTLNRDQSRYQAWVLTFEVVKR